MENKIIPVPTRYRLYTTRMGHSINLEIRNLPDRPESWVIICDGEVLGKDGWWEWEPQPSSRTETFIRDTRYDTVDEAVAHFEKWLEGNGGL